MDAGRRFWRAETGVFLGLWLFLMVVGRARLFQDPGTFWHVATGERVLRRGELVRWDPFSFTADQPWVPFQWLGEILMALAYRLGGLDALLTLAVTILAGLYTWIAHRLLRAGLHWILTAVLVVLVLGGSAIHFHIRPHLATMVFIGATWAVLADFEAGRIGLCRVALLVPIYLAWTSLHGGMLGGLGTLVLAWIGWAAWRVVGWESPLTDLRRTAAVAAIIGACTLTALVNPYGADLPKTWLIILRSPLLPVVVSEHASLGWFAPEAWLLYALLLVYSGVLLTLTCRPRVTWLLPLVWFYLATARVRQAPLFAIITGLALAEMLPRTSWGTQQRHLGAGWLHASSTEPPGWRWLLLPALVVGTSLLFQTLHVSAPVIGHGWAQPDPAQWPFELLPELERLQDRQPGGTPIFNEVGHGGFLILYTPGFRVFIDDRYELYGDNRLREYVFGRPEGMAAQIQEWERRWLFDLALTTTGSVYDRYFSTSPDWSVIQRTATATLYQKVRKAPKTLAEKSQNSDCKRHARPLRSSLIEGDSVRILLS
ncbi:MAG: hypothetical protein K2R98_05165 [Gemmataceae bacterium]|nr:hypothetical protein [Gemmataceae bacterium]